VFEILARNAEEAMGGEGTVIVEAGVTNVALDGPLPLGPGEYLHLTLSDSGAGIDPQIYPVMFSPYTSTKERGTRRGMGMGLAVAQAIMKLHGGALAAEQPTEKGATLHLYLPVPAAEAPTCSNVS